MKKGVVVSEHVGYLDVGLRNGLQHMFLPPEAAEYAGADVNVHATPPPDGLKISAGGWYHFFHIDDIRKIAHRWLYYCEQMRLNPQRYWRVEGSDGKGGVGFGGADHDILTGDAYVGKGQAPWISEMYGYVFSAAEAKLRHILTEGVVVYPDEIGAGRLEEPYIIHYGLHCAVGSFRFTKYSYGNFDATGCTGKTFGDPPAPTRQERLCSETVLTINDAMCQYYNKPEAPQQVSKCCCPPRQRPSSPPAVMPPQRAPGGPGQLGTPRVRPQPPPRGAPSELPFQRTFSFYVVALVEGDSFRCPVSFCVPFRRPRSRRGSSRVRWGRSLAATPHGRRTRRY